MPIATETIEALRAKFDALLPHLDERAQRLTLAAEARSLGHGGIVAVARASGASSARVARGVAELEAGVELTDRVRRVGAGRKPIAVTDPGIVELLLAMVEPTRRGDPESALSWTTLSTQRLAEELTGLGHPVSARKVAQLLKEQGFSLQANSKQIEGRQHPDRDGQFSYLNGQVHDHITAGDAVISVDTKKKELIGEFRNNGREWHPKGAPRAVNVHDFKDQELGKVNPYGVYDVAADTGWVSVGVDHDTSAFAVNTIRSWWNAVGRGAYPGASRLLITADGGGSNGYRTRLWKTELAALAAETGLTITVCHLPPGTSKWNKIEHRLFSRISINWRARPLTSREVVVNTIGATRTASGERVEAVLDTAEYPAGIKIPDTQMQKLVDDGVLTRHEWHGEWNYTLHPDTHT